MKNGEKTNVGFEIRTLSNLIKRHVDNSPFHEKVKSVTGTNMWVIIYLAEHSGENVFQRDLEQKFSVRRSTMSNILALMEKKGLIMRESVEHDARLKKLVLTDTARSFIEMMEEDRENTEAIITSGLSEKELELFYSVVQRMRKNLEDSDGPCEMLPGCRKGRRTK